MRNRRFDPRKDESIMIVDDNTDNLRLLAELIGSIGYGVRPVTDGMSAIRAATAKPPDLIILDIRMPDPDGLEVCRRIKSDPALAEIPVLFISGDDSPGGRADAFKAGGVDYVSKPFNPPEVLARIDAHLRLRRQSILLRKRYDELRQLESQRDRLVGMVVHDIKSPLSALVSSLHVLARDPALVGAASAHAGLENARRIVKRIERMVNDVLDARRIEDGVLRPAIEPCDINGIVREVADECAPLFDGRSFTLAVADAPAIAFVDRSLMVRVLQNLVGNAARHTPEGTGISVSIGAMPGSVRIEVADLGTGLPPGVSEVFGENFAEGFPYPVGGGMGLVFCSLAVKAMGCEISYRPNEPSGCVFRIDSPSEKNMEV